VAQLGISQRLIFRNNDAPAAQGIPGRRGNR